MSHQNRLLLSGTNNVFHFSRVLCTMMMLMIALGLAACNNKDKKPGQALVKVNGEEITMLQFNDELSLAGTSTGNPKSTNKQLIDSLIDRQLIISEAIIHKINRSPEVMRAIERAKSKIIEQAYLKHIVSKITEPTLAEITDYFQKHPEYFSERKQFDMQQLIFAAKDVNDELKATMDSAKSFDTITAWLDRHNIRYTQGQVSRSSTDLPEPMATKLGKMKKGQFFIFNDGESSLLNSISGIKNTPVAFDVAALQIKQYLIRKKSREAIDAEISRLRTLAKIDYLNEQALYIQP